MIRVSVNPELARWAHECSGCVRYKLVSWFYKLSEWETGEIQPTLKRLERFAHTVHLSIGYLFVMESSEYLPISVFFTVADTTGARPSPNLPDTTHTMQRRHVWLRKHLVRIGTQPLTFAGTARLADDPAAVGLEMRCALGLEEHWAEEVRT